MDIQRSNIPIAQTVTSDSVTAEAIAPFDLTMDDVTVFYPYLLPELPEGFNIGVIVGSSGSGKSLLARRIPQTFIARRIDNDFSIAAHFGSAIEAQEKLYAVGMNSIPKWKLPFNCLSNGEQHRFELALALHDNSVIDEFTSVVDRNVAMSLSMAVSKYIRQKQLKRVVFVTCHRDVIPFLKPDWIIDTDAGEYYDSNTEEQAGRWWSEYIKGDYAVGTINYEVGVSGLGD